MRVLQWEKLLTLQHAAARQIFVITKTRDIKKQQRWDSINGVFASLQNHFFCFYSINTSKSQVGFVASGTICFTAASAYQSRGHTLGTFSPTVPSPTQTIQNNAFQIYPRPCPLQLVSNATKLMTQFLTPELKIPICLYSANPVPHKGFGGSCQSTFLLFCSTEARQSSNMKIHSKLSGTCFHSPSSANTTPRQVFAVSQ